MKFVYINADNRIYRERSLHVDDDTGPVKLHVYPGKADKYMANQQKRALQIIDTEAAKVSKALQTILHKQILTITKKALGIEG